MFRFYSIFDHLYLIINDLYAMVFHCYSMTSIYIPNFSFVFYITIFVLYNIELHSIVSYLYFYISHLYSIFSCFYYIIVYLHSIIYICIQCLFITFYKRLFIFDVLHLYSIVKAQENLHNNMCALLGLIRVVAAGWAYMGRRGEGSEGAIICGVAIVGQIGWVEMWKWGWLGGGRVCLGMG